MQPNRDMAKPGILPGIKALLFNCAGITADDKIFIVSNPSTSKLGEMLKNEASSTCKHVEHQVIGEFKIHGQEPGPDVSDKMFNATVVFCLTKMSMAHTKARLNANINKARYFSLPDYSDEVISSKALLADFRSIKDLSMKLAHLLSNAGEIKLLSKKGTNLTMNISGRKANPAPGFCFDDVLLASPPDAETNIAPNEYLTHGIAVVDGSIPCREIGLLDSPITLEIESGYVKNVIGNRSEILNALLDKQRDPKCRIVAEFGIGLNKRAELTGSMLEDEGTLGTIHLGIGSNKTIGGLNEVPFHLDHIICKATVIVDNITIMEEGVFVKEFSDLL